MTFRRNHGILSNSASADPACDADVIMTAAVLGFASKQVSQTHPVRFDVEPGSPPSDWDRFTGIVERIDRAVVDHLRAEGLEPEGGVNAGLSPDHTKGAVIMGVYKIAGQEAPASVGEPELSPKGQVLYNRIKNEEVSQYTGRGAYTGFVDNWNSEGKTSPIGPRPTARFLVPAVEEHHDHANRGWAGSRWLPPVESPLWADRRRLGTKNSFVPWGMIGGDKAWKPGAGDNANLADQISSEMRDRYGMVFNGEPTNDDIVAYTHGMIHCIYKAYALGPSCAPYEITVGTQTTKLASCLPCTLFMTASGYPPTSIHLGRGESWAPLFAPYNPGEASEPNERGVINDLNYAWCLSCKEFLETGLAILDDAHIEQSHIKARDALCAYLNAADGDESAAMLILDALTIHDSEANRVDRTLRTLPPL